MLRLAGKPTFQWMQQFADHLKLSNGETQVLLRTIMNGPDAFKLLNNKIVSRERLGDDAYNLCFEYACLIAGEGKLLAASVETLPDQPHNDSEWEQFLWLERKYLKGHSFWQRGDLGQGWNEWNLIYLQTNITPQVERLIVSIRVNETIDLLNKGYFARAATKFEKILKEKRTSLDLMTLHNLFGPLAICYSCTGRLVDSSNIHTDIDKLLTHFDSYHLNALAARRKAMHFIQKDAFDTAEELIIDALNIHNLSKTRRAILLEHQFEILILKHELEKADSLLKTMQQLIAQEPLSVGLLNIIEEETELLLRQFRPDEALEKIKQILAEAHERGDILAELKGKTFLARAFYLKQNYRSALQIMEDLIPVAQEQGYGSPLIYMLFHASGIAWHAKNREALQTYLNQAHTLSRKFGLKVRSKCFAYLLALHSSEQKTTKPLLEVITISENGSEVDYLLDVYGFPDSNKYTLENGESELVLTERNIRSFIRKNYGIYWFKRERAIVVNSAAGINRVEFNGNESFQKIFELFIKTKSGISNDDIHAVDSKTEYHSLKHGGKVRATLHRFRKTIEPYGIDIVYNRISTKLCLSDSSNIYFVSACN